MKCPNRRLENPENAERCDCGYDFVNGEVKDSFLKRQHKVISKGLTRWRYVISILAPLIGIFIGINIGFSKDMNTSDGYKYDKDSRFKGRMIFFASLFMLIVLSVRVLIKLLSLNTGHPKF